MVCVCVCVCVCGVGVVCVWTDHVVWVDELVEVEHGGETHSVIEFNPMHCRIVKVKSHQLKCEEIRESLEL